MILMALSKSPVKRSLGNRLSQLLLRQFKNLYYQARESIGDHKRMLVVEQVSHACVSLGETRDEFADALERFKNLVHVADSGLEQKYNLLNRQYQFCLAKSEAVSYRIKAIETVSEALFAEWESELEDYSNRNLRNSSKQQLKAAKQNYAKLIKTMRRAEDKIQPVLAAFKDQVLHLKHNLNARAIAALQHEFIEITLDISQLILAMEQTIAEANQFVAVLVEQQPTAQKALPKN